MTLQNGLGVYCVCSFVIALAALTAGCRKGGNDAMSGLANSQEDLMKGIVTIPTPETPKTLAEKKTQLESNLKQAMQSSAQGNLDDAIKTLESSVLLDYKNRDVLLQLVKALRGRSRELVTEDPAQSYRLMVSAGAYLKTLQAAHNDFTNDEKELFAGVLFDEACAHARSKRREEFTGAFNAAIGEGFADLERLKNEPDLAEFRTVPELKSLIDQAIENVSSRK